MYTQYFGFQKPPFKVTPDSGFFYTNSTFLSAHNSLLDAIDEQRGLALLTGAAGTGKTTLLKQLAQDLDDTVHFIYLQNSNLNQRDLVGRLSEKLGSEPSDQQQISVEAEIYRLRDHLKVLNDREQGCVLFIDDAQNLPQDSLNTLPLLIKADGGGNQVQVVLSGTEELLERLNAPELSAVLRLVEAHAQLERLPAAEIPAFIDHQIRVAGSMRSDIFSEGAIREIVQTTSGRPSDLNKVCDKALEIAYRQGTQVVTREMIRQTSSAAWQNPETPEPAARQRPNSVRRLAEKFRPSGSDGRRFATTSVAGKLAALRHRLPERASGLGRQAAILGRKMTERSGVFALVALAKVWRLIGRLGVSLRSTARWLSGQSTSESHGDEVRPSRRRLWIAGSATAIAALLAVLILPLVNDDADNERQTASVQTDGKIAAEQRASGRRLTELADLRAQIAQLNLDLRTTGSNRDYLKRLVGSLTAERDELEAELAQAKFQNQKLQLNLEAARQEVATLQSDLSLARSAERSAPEEQTDPKAQTGPADQLAIDAAKQAPDNGSDSAVTAVKVSNPGPSAPFEEPSDPAGGPMEYIRDGDQVLENTAARQTDSSPSEGEPGLIPADELAITPVAAELPAGDGTADTQPQAKQEQKKPYSNRAVALLLEKARRLYLKDLLTTPEDNNAYDIYMQILENDPDQRQAIAGIKRIAARYLTWATNEENSNNRSNALRYYKKALEVLPDTPQIQQRIAELETGQPLKAADATPVEIASQSEKARTRLKTLGIETSERSLLRAVEAGNREIAALLLDAGISPDAQNVGKQTALLTAAINGDEAMARLLLKRGATVNKANNLGRSPLSAAAWNGHTALTAILLEGGAEIEATSKEGWNALMYAAWNGHRATVRALLENGSRVDAVNGQGWTALMNAAWNGHSETVVVLLEHGANPGYETPAGETALLVASQQGHSETALLLD